jgi:hypothetical protein
MSPERIIEVARRIVETGGGIVSASSQPAGSFHGHLLARAADELLHAVMDQPLAEAPAIARGTTRTASPASLKRSVARCATPTLHQLAQHSIATLTRSWQLAGHGGLPAASMVKTAPRPCAILFLVVAGSSCSKAIQSPPCRGPHHAGAVAHRRRRTDRSCAARRHGRACDTDVVRLRFDAHCA